MRQKYRAQPLFSEETMDKLEQDWNRYDEDGELADLFTSGMLQECMTDLTDNQRRLLNLRYASGLKSVEIAQRLNMNVKTVYQAIARIHRKLADCVRKKQELCATKRGTFDE